MNRDESMRELDCDAVKVFGAKYCEMEAGCPLLSDSGGEDARLGQGGQNRVVRTGR